MEPTTGLLRGLYAAKLKMIRPAPVLAGFPIYIRSLSAFGVNRRRRNAISPGPPEPCEGGKRVERPLSQSFQKVRAGASQPVPAGRFHRVEQEGRQDARPPTQAGSLTSARRRARPLEPAEVTVLADSDGIYTAQGATRFQPAGRIGPKALPT